MDKSNYSLLLSLFGLVEVLDGFGLIGLLLSSLLLEVLEIRFFVQVAGK